MTWVRLDDDFLNHPKVIKAGPLAVALFVNSLCYSSKYLTDGFVPAGVVSEIARGRGAVSASRLVEAGLWEKVEDGYRIHDYLEYNPARADILEKRAKAKERMSVVRANGERTALLNEGGVRANESRSSPEVRSTPYPLPYPDPGSTSKDSEVHVGDTSVAASPPARAPENGDASEIFAFYRSRIHALARVDGSQQIRARLKTFSVDELRLAVEHFSQDQWEMKHNRTRGAPWFFKSDARIEHYVNMEPRLERVNGQARFGKTGTGGRVDHNPQAAHRGSDGGGNQDRRPRGKYDDGTAEMQRLYGPRMAASGAEEELA